MLTKMSQSFSERRGRGGRCRMNGNESLYATSAYSLYGPQLQACHLRVLITLTKLLVNFGTRMRHVEKCQHSCVMCNPKLTGNP